MPREEPPQVRMGNELTYSTDSMLFKLSRAQHRAVLRQGQATLDLFESLHRSDFRRSLALQCIQSLLYRPKEVKKDSL